MGILMKILIGIIGLCGAVYYAIKWGKNHQAKIKAKTPIVMMIFFIFFSVTGFISYKAAPTYAGVKVTAQQKEQLSDLINKEKIVVSSFSNNNKDRGTLNREIMNIRTPYLKLTKGIPANYMLKEAISELKKVKPGGSDIYLVYYSISGINSEIAKSVSRKGYDDKSFKAVFYKLNKDSNADSLKTPEQ
ncbi:hypothetical protein [Lapidilactobacillus wuchangensis]|uniref:hypothetical protein n=1 Tax=Lapidilactobacillus wuchangensis TaxID=2486001 RepID=UPI000F7930A9|nr:hypothetical protein [Lapidilactobacillus wuchangensis]